jgi:hypothetical protein
VENLYNIEWAKMSGVPPYALPPGPVFAIEVDPEVPAVIYTGTDEGVYRSTDGGASWHSFNEGLPHTSVRYIKRHRQLPLLRVGTYGRGVWERNISGKPCPPLGIASRRS